MLCWLHMSFHMKIDAPLSIVTLAGMPKRATHEAIKVSLHVLASLYLIVTACTHLVDVSVAVSGIRVHVVGIRVHVVRLKEGLPCPRPSG
jgi:hypothetical protein